MNTSLVTLLESVRIKSWSGIGEIDTTLGQVLPLREALVGDYGNQDVCIVQYRPADRSEREFPRLSKAAVAIYVIAGRESPVLDVVLIDVDHENHTPPPEGWAETLWELNPWPGVGGWYRTPNGMRLIYTLAEPVEIKYADSFIQQLHEELQSAGIPTDSGTTDWTRLFFAPRAKGRNLPAYLDDIDNPLTWRPETLEVCTPRQCGKIIDRDFGTAVDSIGSDKLSRRDVEALGRGSRLADLLYRGQLAAPVGERHSTLLGAALEVVQALDTRDPLAVFRLLAPSARSMDKPLDEVWRIAEWVCAQHSGAIEEKERLLSETLRDMADTLDTTTDVAMSRLIIDAGKEAFVWDERRQEYSTGYSHAHQLLGALQRHCPVLAEGYYDGKKSREEIMRDLSTVADRVVYSYSGETHYDPDRYIFYRRVCEVDRELSPQYDEGVNAWLKALFADRFEQGLDWLAAFPRLDRPVCALYIHGDPSIGKEMFGKGLARLYTQECVVLPYAQIFKEFNPQLKDSPVIWADEKVPQESFSANDSSIFRRVVGNSSFQIRDLYRAPAMLEGFPRVIITANNDDALQIREDLSVEDLEAIRLRVGYIRTDGSAAEVLRRLAAAGGWSCVREMTEGWVRGGAIARHVLWLAENRPIKPGHRLMVEGWESSFTESLTTATGATGVVAEALAILIANDPDQVLSEVRWFGGYVYVNNQGLGRIWRSIIRNNDERSPSSTRRLKSLRALAGEERARLDDPAVQYGRKQLSYWKIDGIMLARLAEERNICSSDQLLQAVSREAEPELVTLPRINKTGVVAGRKTEAR